MSNGKKQKTYILLGIPALFLVGGLFHFLYSLSGEAYPVGLIAPVNESIFEHTKMAALPVFLWWGVLYLADKKNLRRDPWFTGALLSMVVTIVSIPLLYYFYTGAFGADNPIADALVFLAALTLGQLAGLHCYRHGGGMDYRIAILLMLAILIIFAVFTVDPPRLPIFRDPRNGSSGIT